MPRSPGNDIAEIFGHAPDDLTVAARSLWAINACPFVNGPCTKKNHDKSITYGVCSVRNANGDEVITCPKRLYTDEYKILRTISEEAFGNHVPFRMYDEFVRHREKAKPSVVALGHRSGHEVGLGKQLKIDWILACIQNARLIDFAGVEVQSMDITGNYRECWESYHSLPASPNQQIVPSEHGINWANVHKRLIPQLIRKGSVFRKSSLSTKGLYFVLPEIVFQKFVDIVGEIADSAESDNSVITVHTYALGPSVKHGEKRRLIRVRTKRLSLTAFIEGFVAGSNLPSGEDLENAIRTALGLQ